MVLARCCQAPGDVQQAHGIKTGFTDIVLTSTVLGEFSSVLLSDR